MSASPRCHDHIFCYRERFSILASPATGPLLSAETLLNTALSGRYQVERTIGLGGMATVYLARDIKHNRHVALKVLDWVKLRPRAERT